MIARAVASCLQRPNPNLSATYIEIFNHIRQSKLRLRQKAPFACHYQKYPDLQKRYVHTAGHDEPEGVPGSHVLSRYKSSLSFPKADVQLRDLSKAGLHEGDEIIVHGYFFASPWSKRSKRLQFVTLQDVDLDHSIQVVWNLPKEATDYDRAVHGKVLSLRNHSPIAIKGTVQKRDSEGVDGLHTVKDIEIHLQDITILNEFPKDIIAKQETVFPPEKRHLQLRNSKALRDAIRFRSNAMTICRQELTTRAIPFVEIETPLLFKSTPEGAREFIIPTREKGYAYALPQSPQQYKQILMAGGFPRYFQFAKCFRDEDLRADRQPEFTQLDMEMSFATGEEVMSCTESIIKKLWRELLNATIHDGLFPRMTYKEAMSKYGSDKPDVRLGMEISNIGYLLPADMISKITHLPDPAVEMLKFSISEDPKETRRFITSFMDSPEAEEFIKNPEGGPGIFVFDPRAPLQGLGALGFEAAEAMGENLEDGDLIVLQARRNKPFTGGSTALGNIRKALHNHATKNGHYDPPRGFDIRWIIDFPLFSPTTATEPGQGGAAGISSTHHPFTSPKTPADVDLLLTDPSSAIADHYDLVVNGVELGGGSRRIHDAAMQEFVLTEVLKMPKERLAQFSHLLEALRAGCPPHAGIALGFDRLIAVMLGRESVRDVIAFPKSGRGEDCMVRSPGVMSKETLETYHLKLRE